jgi:RNA polymerase sigma factor (sigma-70 family)
MSLLSPAMLTTMPSGRRMVWGPPVQCAPGPVWVDSRPGEIDAVAMDHPLPIGRPTAVESAPTPVVVPRYEATEAGFEALYRAEYRAVVAVVHSLTGRRDVAEEITQDAFVITHDRWRKVAGYERPADFVRRVALNRALSSLRRKGAEHRAFEKFQSRSRPALAEVGGDDETGLWAAVRKLPDRQAQAIALMYVEDQPVQRVAEILGCSENTVKTHLKRARATLAAALGEVEGRRRRS